MSVPWMREYLGDGLYAEFDGYQIRLWCEREFGVIHEVYLDANVYEALKRLVSAIESKHGGLP